MQLTSHKCHVKRIREPLSGSNRGATSALRASAPSQTLDLLDSFWEARGVLDKDKRKQLVEHAYQLQQQGSPQDLPASILQPDQPLPGVSAAWSSVQAAPEVAEVSRRLMRLQELLGGEGVDVVWMVVREPSLLTADFSAVTQQLWRLKLESLELGVDIIKVLERQPGLLLQPGTTSAAVGAAVAAAPTAAPSTTPAVAAISSPSNPRRSLAESSTRAATSASTRPPTRSTSTTSSKSSSSSSGQLEGAQSGETAAGKLQAWQYGLVTDNDAEWERRLQQLADYRRQHGDANVGFRDEDDPELGRWASKQRSDCRRGDLPPSRVERLEALGFEFSADEAEWQRWFRELLCYRQQHGHCNPPPLATGSDFYLINWCSVQRVARRSRVLPASRQDLLDGVGFDWTGADPLS